MGFVGLDAAYGASDASITFNSAFSFYYGSSPSVPAGLVDFETVAAHEIGHALGFISDVDDVDAGATTVSPTVLDLYRFAAGNVPTTAAQFTTTARSMLANSAAVTSDTVNQWAMSTGVNTGDGRQASHWKDDALTASLIGIMDPTLASGVREGISAADIRAMELIGYDLAPAVPEPGTIVLFGAGFVVFAIRRNRRPATHN
jgi:hypothetical protein